MRLFLLRLFFHGRFWPRTLGRMLWLLLQRKKLKVKAVGLDRAYYYAGSNVVLGWEVENAWLITVNHPGGFYHHSDSTWYTAAEDMPEVRITIRGWGGKVRKELPVRVKPFAPATQTQQIYQVRTRSGRIHRGPQLKTKARAITQYRVQLRETAELLPREASPATSTTRDLARIRRCQDPEAFAALKDELCAHYGLSPVPETDPPTTHGTE